MFSMNHLTVRCVLALGLTCAASIQAAERIEVGNRIADGPTSPRLQ